MFGVAEPGCGLSVDERSEPGRTPAGLLLTFTAGSVDGQFAVVDLADRNLPAPGIGDEAVPPHQQDALSIIDHDAARTWRRADDAMLQMPTIRKLHVSDPDVEPLIVVQRLLGPDFPAHAAPPREDPALHLASSRCQQLTGDLQTAR